LEADGNPFQRFLAAQNSARIALDRGKAVEAEPTFERVHTRAEEVAGLAAKGDAAAWLARAQFMHGHPNQGLQSVAETMEIAEATDTGGLVFQAHQAHSEGAGRFAAYEEALAEADAMLGYVLQQLPQWENAARYLRARALLGLGQIDEAAEEIDSAYALSPEGINGWRWRLRIEAFRLAVLAAQGGEWPKARAEDLTDELLQGQWLDIAAELMAVRAGVEEDKELAKQSAALALQLGIPTTAAQAIDAGELWDDPAAAAVASRIKETSRSVPDEWQEAWAAQSAIAAGLTAPDVVDEELAEAAAALQADLDAALLAAGLADPDTALSPAQRREQGLVRRTPGRARRGALILGAAAAIAILALGGGALAATVFAADPETIVVTETVAPTTTILALEATRVTEDLPPHFGGSWETVGGNQAHTGGTSSSGVAQPDGYYWRNDQSQAQFFASPIVVGQRLVIGALDGEVYLIDRVKGDDLSLTLVQSTGGRIDITAAAAEIAATSVSSSLGVVIVANGDGTLYAFNTNDGREMWSEEFPTCCTPAVDGASGLVLVAGIDRLHAVDTSNGDEVWSWSNGEVGLEGSITTDITLAGGRVYFGVEDQLWQVDLTTQEGTQCDVKTGGDFVTPVVSEGVIYAANQDGFVHMLDVETCKWFDNIAVLEELTVKPAVHNGIIYQPGRRGVSAYDPSLASEDRSIWGSPKPIREGEFLSPEVKGSPAVANGMVYFGASDGFVYALDAATGALIWEWDEGVPISAEVAVGDRAVYVATRAGDVIAIAPVASERLAEGSARSDDEPDSGSPGVVPPDDSSPTTTVPPSRGGGGGTM
jgi:outer membrane protein assembly factor BamB/tetratricopeptide (TPR) repeat protein